MKAYIWQNVSWATTNYHDAGGVLVVAGDLDQVSLGARRSRHRQGRAVSQFWPLVPLRFICDAGHTVLTAEWRDWLERGDQRCNAPIPGGKCGAEFGDLLVDADDFARLLLRGENIGRASECTPTPDQSEPNTRPGQ
jgi:hypothetical protein